MSQKVFKKGYCSRYGKNEEGPWTHEELSNGGLWGGSFPSNICYNDILEECLRKEFDEKLKHAKFNNEEMKKEIKELKQEVALLKQALSDALEALALK